MDFLKGILGSKPTEVTEQAKTEALAHRMVGARLQRTGKFEQAATEFRAAVKCDPGDAEAHMWLGIVYGTLGRTREALAEHQTGVRLAPGSAVGHYAFANFLYAQKRLAEAATEVERAVSICLDDAGYRSFSARVNADLYRLDEAIQQAQEAVRLAPDSADTHDALAWVYFRQSRTLDLMAELEVVERLGGSTFSQEMLPMMRKYQAEGRLK